MARERWFYAHEDARHGPHQLPELVDALLALPDPRTRLVWTRGLETWMRAGRVPRLSEELSRHLPEPAPPPPAPPRAPASATPASGVTAPRAPRPAATPAAIPAEAVGAGAGLPRPALYAGGALLLAIAVGAVVLGLRGGEEAPVGAPTGSGGVAVAPGGGTAPGAAATDPATGAAAATGGEAAAPGVVGWSAVETDVPATEFALLKGVAAWEGDELTVTLYNGSRWRITEILVRTSVLEGDHFVDAALLHPLVLRQNVDANVAPILEQVAPDRRRPAVNPDDTRAFSGRAGEKPRAYRWRIEAARGYAPILR